MLLEQAEMQARFDTELKDARARHDTQLGDLQSKHETLSDQNKAALDKKRDLEGEAKE